MACARVPHLHVQLGDGDAAVVRGEVVAIAPLAVGELRAVDDDLGQLDAGAGGNGLGDDVDAGVEAEDEPGVVPIGDEVSTGEQDFAGGRDGARGLLGGGDHGRCLAMEGVACVQSEHMHVRERVSE